MIILNDSIKTVRNLHSTPGHTYTANDEILAKRAADLLDKHYPNHLWAVFVNSEEQGGVMHIKNFSISYRYGMVLHLNKLDPDLKKVIRSGGELLERAAMARGKWNGRQAGSLEGAKHQPIPELGIII